MLWGEAYDATPAGSLPDDDDELAEAAGFGLDVEHFLLHKAEIMAPWVLCSDGRWYHPTVCEVARETWELQSAKRRADAERKARSRAAVSVVTRDMADVTPDIGTQTDRTDRRGRTKGSKKPFVASSLRAQPEARPEGASGLRVIEGGAEITRNEAIYRARQALKVESDPGRATELERFIRDSEAAFFAEIVEQQA